MTMEKMKRDIRAQLSFLDYAPILFISAKTGSRVNQIYEQINFVYDQARKRITTGKLNEAIVDFVMMKQPPSKAGRRLKIYYGSQVSVDPPTFVLFVNDSAIMHFSYKRYLENQIYKTFDFFGTPIRLFIRNRNE